MKYSYTNTSHEVIKTDVEPIDYKGFQIFHRIKSAAIDGNVFDILSNGNWLASRVCIEGAKEYVNDMIDYINYYSPKPKQSSLF